MFDCPANEDEAAAMGFAPMGHGIIGMDECDAGGRMLSHNYIGRISDDVPNLLAVLSSAEELRELDSGETGRVAIEFCLRVYALIEPVCGRLAARAAVIGVNMDLGTRKAVRISAESQRLLTDKLLLGS